MLRNYFKIAWKNITKTRFYSFLNISGLSIGLAFTFIIAAFIWSELQVNNNLRDIDRLYMLQSRWKKPNMGGEITTVAPLAKELKIQYPDLVENYYRIDAVTSNVSKNDKIYREIIQIGDSSFFDMFGFQLEHGSINKAMIDPFTAVITEPVALKYFGRTDVTGETVTIENFSGLKHEFLIAGVLKNADRNTITELNAANHFGIFIPESSISYFGRQMDNWNQTHIIGYLKLQTGVTPSDLQKPLMQLLHSRASEEITNNLQPFLAPLKTYYLNAGNGLVKNMLYALAFIAVFMMLMAVVNFTNMAVSRSGSRLKEIGVRKVLGGSKQQLMLQFLTESVILVLISTIFSFFLYFISRDFFSSLLGNRVPSLAELPTAFFLLGILLAIVIGLLAGLYPAVVLSSLRTADSVKGKLSSVKEKVLLRRMLIGFQFVISVIVLVGAFVVSGQINYFLGKNLGYDKDYVVTAQVPRDWTSEGVQKMENVRNQFARMPILRQVSLSYEIPNGNNSGSVMLIPADGNVDRNISAQFLSADQHFANTYNIPMVSGAFFTGSALLTDTSKVVINEAAAKALGWNASDALGKKIKTSNDNTLFTVAGVTKDFHFGSMKNEIPPILFVHIEASKIFRYLSFKLNPGDPQKSISALQAKWSELLPGAAFEYQFMDDTLTSIYKTELQLKKAAFTASIMALVIMLLGVIGLVSLNIQKRIKEIGIRKVLGSSTPAIVALFIKDFISVIIIAGIIACPLAFYIMNNWLSGYAYRIALTGYPFLISIMLLVIITIVVISLNTIKAARANPVESLRSE